MTSITKFLEARIDEDEAEASEWQDSRVLAECTAKRLILGHYKCHSESRDAGRTKLARSSEDKRAKQDRRLQEARARVAGDSIRALAAVYSDHPDYQQEWAA